MSLVAPSAEIYLRIAKILVSVDSQDSRWYSSCAVTKLSETSGRSKRWLMSSSSSTPEERSFRLADVAYGSESGRIVESTGLGLRFRRPVDGPEQKLVHQFLASTTISVPPERRVTVFCEPCLESGVPDIVAVIWREDLMAKWSEHRESLTSRDIKVLQFLYSHSGWMSHDKLKATFGTKKAEQSIARLYEAEMIHLGRKSLRLRSVKTIFAAERILSLEVKVAYWRKAIQQACTNMWFGSDSYTLMPRISSIDEMLTMAQSRSIGVLEATNDGAIELNRSTRKSVPGSYASWLFNEWTWRIARSEGWI